MFRADLHCHSIYSDGQLTPEELIVKAKAVGLSGLSITDHDTIAAYENAPVFAKEQQILLGSGVEFSCVYQEVNIHILGYDFDVHHSGLKTFCEKHKLRRKNRNRAILEKLKRFSMILEEDELNSMGHIIGRPHIAQLLVQKGHVGSIKDAFQRYIGDDMPCYHRGEGFSVEETIAIIHEAHGKAFVAHPHLLRRSTIIKALLKLPFDGIECYYSNLSADREKRWIKLVKDKGLLVSGGSDYHGDFREHNPLGCSWVDEESFNKIFQHLL